jgi:2-hydroxy-3-oxopropionate reductase
VHNRSAHKEAPLLAEGAAAARSPREVAERSDVIVTMLPDSPDVERVIAGPGGVLEGIRPGALVVDMSTISPGVTRALAARVAERGASLLDAPVSGGDVGAINGTLTIMVGGDARDFARARPLFEAMGKNIVHVGGTGAGQVTKAANQVVVALVIAAVAEGLTLGTRGGVPAATLLDVLGTGVAGNRVMELKRQKLLTHVFDPGFRSELHLKDLGIALAEGHEAGVALPVTALVETLFARMKESGWGGEDHSGLIKVIESMSEPPRA